MSGREHTVQLDHCNMCTLRLNVSVPIYRAVSIKICFLFFISEFGCLLLSQNYAVSALKGFQLCEVQL